MINQKSWGVAYSDKAILSLIPSSQVQRSSFKGRNITGYISSEACDKQQGMPTNLEMSLDCLQQ